MKWWVATLLMLPLLAVSWSDAAEQCELTGYQLSPLKDKDYWSFRLDNVRDCILPENATEDEIDYCDIFISACHPLGRVCDGHPNSTTCQQVVLKLGNGPYFYDMGTFTIPNEFNPLNGNSTGFQATRTGLEPVSSVECNSTIYTILSFVCEEDAEWSDTNITSFVASASQLFGACNYLINLRYSGGCYEAPTLSPSHCSIGDYDTSMISSRDYWSATVDSDACYGFGADSCIFYMAFCHPVPPELGDTCYKSAVCQKARTEEDDYVQELSMGAFTNYTHFYENDEDGENGGFRMLVENGSRPDNETCKDGLTTELIFVCDETAEWNAQDITDFLELVYHEGSDPCLYVLKMRYNGACQKKVSILDKYSPVGWIFIGLFLFVVITYLVIGSAFMFFVRKERGLRILPNFEFWKNFLILVLEGCRFFLDIVTCFQFDGKVPKRTPDYDKI